MKNRKFFISIFMIFFVNLAIIAGSVYFYSETQKKMEDINKLKKELLLAEKTAQNARDLKLLMPEVKAGLEKINPVFLNKDNLVVFIEAAEQTAKDTGVSLKFDSVDTDKKGFGNPVFKMSLEGDFSPVAKFIKLFEAMPYQFIFHEAKIFKSGDLWRANLAVELASFANQ